MKWNKWISIVLTVLLTSCSTVSTKKESQYADASNWVYEETEESDKEADVFFVNPTVYMGDEDHLYWEEYDDDTKESFIGAVNMEKGIYDDNARFFAPYYHQASLQAYYVDSEESEEAFDHAYEEIEDSFTYYLNTYNQGRPLVLAGFSQGAQMCIRLLEEHSKELDDILVACYAIGWRFTTEEQEKYPDIHFATSELDTDVLIAFDCEDPSITDTLIIPADEKTLSINPLNWKTDSSVADASLNLGACFTDYDGNITEEIPNLTGAYIDETRGALKVTDINMEDYPAKIFDDGIYHLYDYEFFYRNLEKNVQNRIQSYLNQ